MASAHAQRTTAVRTAEQELCERVRQGDREAFERVWQDHHAAVDRYVVRLARWSPDEVDDLVADTFASTLRALLNGHGPRGEVRPYLFSVARNHLQRRGARARMEYPAGDFIEQTNDCDEFEDRITSYAEAREIAELLGSLSPQHREALRMRYLEGQSLARMSARLEVSTAVLASRLYRARDALRRAYVRSRLEHAETRLEHAATSGTSGRARQGAESAAAR